MCRAPAAGVGAREAALLLLGLLGVARARLGLAQRADGRVAVDLLVARQARLHRRRLLPADTTERHFLPRARPSSPTSFTHSIIICSFSNFHKNIFVFGWLTLLTRSGHVYHFCTQ